MARYGTAEPMTRRLERERQAKKRKTYTITVYMYKQQADENHNDDINGSHGHQSTTSGYSENHEEKKDVPRS